MPNFIESISNALKILIISSKRFDNLNFENAQCPKASKRLLDQVQFNKEIFKMLFVKSRYKRLEKNKKKNIQSNLCATTTPGTLKQWSLFRGGRYSEGVPK